MTTTINASTSSGLVVTPDNSGNVLLQYNGVAAPAFSATTSTYTSISSGVWTKVILNTKQFDTNNNFDAVTNYRFTPTVAGYYLITGAVADNNSNTPTRNIGKIYKNGSAYNYVGGDQVTGYVPSFSAVIYMNGTTDYIELYQYVVASGPTSEGQMTGCLLRGA